MKKLTIALILFILIVGIGNSRQADIVTVQYGGNVIDRYTKTDYTNMMIYLRFCKEITAAEKNGRVHLFMDDSGLKVIWRNQSGKAIKEIKFNNLDGIHE